MTKEKNPLSLALILTLFLQSVYHSLQVRRFSSNNVNWSERVWNERRLLKCFLFFCTHELRNEQFETSDIFIHKATITTRGTYTTAELCDGRSENKLLSCRRHSHHYRPWGYSLKVVGRLRSSRVSVTSPQSLLDKSPQTFLVYGITLSLHILIYYSCTVNDAGIRVYTTLHRWFITIRTKSDLKLVTFA